MIYIFISNSEFKFGQALDQLIIYDHVRQKSICKQIGPDRWLVMQSLLRRLEIYRVDFIQ